MSDSKIAFAAMISVMSENNLLSISEMQQILEQHIQQRNPPPLDTPLLPIKDSWGCLETDLVFALNTLTPMELTEFIASIPHAWVYDNNKTLSVSERVDWFMCFRTNVNASIESIALLFIRKHPNSAVAFRISRYMK